MKAEDFVFENKTGTIKAWQNSRDYVVQIFQRGIPVSHQFVMDVGQTDEFRRHYRQEPFDWLKKRACEFVEGCTRLKIQKFMLQ
jgi:hypothetical protein